MRRAVDITNVVGAYVERMTGKQRLSASVDSELLEAGVAAVAAGRAPRRSRPRTHGGVVAQGWRGGTGRQASLARLLAGVEVVPVDGSLGRRAGMLFGRAGATDVVDACVVLLAADGDDIITSDHDDLRALAVAAGVHVELIPA